MLKQDRFRRAAGRILPCPLEAQSIIVIEQMISRYEKNLGRRVVQYEDFLLATRKAAVSQQFATIDRNWYDAWRNVRVNMWNH